jgi:8-oxo-dGTP diphosphatase
MFTRGTPFLQSVDPIEKLKRRLNRLEDVDAEAAVAALLMRGEEGLKVLLVKRSENPSDPWSGQMAFPGGRRRLEDHDLKDTVVRETFEETGIDLDRYLFLGTLDMAFSKVVKGLGVLPFVVLAEERPNIVLNEELCSYLWIPIDLLNLSKGSARMKQREVPAYTVEGHVVWGLTYRIIENLLGLMSTQKK